MLLPLYTSMSSDFFLSFSLSFCLLYFIIFISNTISGFGSFIRFSDLAKLYKFLLLLLLILFFVLVMWFFFFDEKFSNIVTQYLCVQYTNLNFEFVCFFFHFENPPCITHHYITALIIKILQFFQPTTKPSHYLCFYFMNIIYIYMFYSETSSLKSFLHSCFSWFDFFFLLLLPNTTTILFIENLQWVFFSLLLFFWFVVGGFIFFLFFKKDKIISTIKAESCFFLNSFCFCCCCFLFFSSESHYTQDI